MKKENKSPFKKFAREKTFLLQMMKTNWHSKNFEAKKLSSVDDLGHIIIIISWIKSRSNKNRKKIWPTFSDYYWQKTYYPSFCVLPKKLLTLMAQIICFSYDSMKKSDSSWFSGVCFALWNSKVFVNHKFLVLADKAVDISFFNKDFENQLKPKKDLSKNDLQ